MNYYYVSNVEESVISLQDEEFQHCIKVMHHKKGDNVILVDGKGKKIAAKIIEIEKKRCILNVISDTFSKEKQDFNLHIAIAPTKNRERTEWFVEKAVEIGISEISFIICDHSEKSKIDLERITRIAVSAMKQSQTSWLPNFKVLNFEKFIINEKDNKSDKFIAWCSKKDTIKQLCNIHLKEKKAVLLIGPEGDFSQKEVSLALESNFQEVLLGKKRLRTETAGIYGCIFLNILFSNLDK